MCLTHAGLPTSGVAPRLSLLDRRLDDRLAVKRDVWGLLKADLPKGSGGGITATVSLSANGLWRRPNGNGPTSLHSGSGTASLPNISGVGTSIEHLLRKTMDIAPFTPDSKAGSTAPMHAVHMGRAARGRSRPGKPVSTEKRVVCPRSSAYLQRPFQADGSSCFGNARSSGPITLAR